MKSLPELDALGRRLNEQLSNVVTAVLMFSSAFQRGRYSGAELLEELNRILS